MTGSHGSSLDGESALLDAAEQLFAGRGIASSTIADICDAAACSIDAFYRHYRDKRSVLVALFERYETDYREVSHVIRDPCHWDGATLGDILLTLMQMGLARHRNMPFRMRVGMELAYADPEMAIHFVALLSVRDASIRNLLASRRDEIGHPDPDLAAAYVVDQLGAMTRARVSEPNPTSGLGKRSDEDFVREAMLSVCAYLQIGLPADL